MRFVILLLLTSALLTACGQRGPLYLPEDAAPKPPSQQPSAPPAPSPATP